MEQLLNIELEQKGSAPLSENQFIDADSRWQAVKDRDSAADGQFYFSVLTTGVFCKPSCGARLPNRENVNFYETIEEAQSAGYRPCKRCKPTSAPLADRHAELVEKACRFIETSEEEPSLTDMAEHVEMSPHYFNRIFKKVTGVTPKQFVIGRRAETVKTELEQGSKVTDAIYAAGYGAASRFYDGAKPRLGMPAASFKSGGKGIAIRYSIEKCWLGLILVAASEKGICSILFDETETSLEADLRKRFPNAVIEKSENGSDFDKWISEVLQFVKKPAGGHNLPLDIHGTAFQERVWRALQTIPPGQTASYTEVAKLIGKPKASRAVAAACAANPVAVAIPCHRVVRSNGELSGYRWGIERKRQLLDREAS